MKPIRFLRWSVINAAFGVCVYYALYRNVQWCDNVMVFITWATAVITVIGACTESIRASVSKVGRSAPLWLSLGYDVALILVLAAFGRFGLAVLWLVQAFFDGALYMEPKKK